MKKWFITKVSVWTILLGYPLHLKAEADGPDYYEVVHVSPNSFLNLRQSPHTTADILYRIPPGGFGLKNQGRFADKFGKILPGDDSSAEARVPYWAEVEYQGIIGWAALAYLQESETASALSETDFFPGVRNDFDDLPADARFFFRWAYSCGEWGALIIGATTPNDAEAKAAELRRQRLQCDREFGPDGELGPHGRMIKNKYENHQRVQEEFLRWSAAG